MGLGKLGNTIEILSAIFSSGGSSVRRQVILEGPTGKLVIPVTPAKYSIGDGQKNKVVDITKSGKHWYLECRKLAHYLFQAFSHRHPMIILLLSRHPGTYSVC